MQHFSAAMLPAHKPAHTPLRSSFRSVGKPGQSSTESMHALLLPVFRTEPVLAAFCTDYECKAEHSEEGRTLQPWPLLTESVRYPLKTLIVRLNEQSMDS